MHCGDMAAEQRLPSKDLEAFLKKNTVVMGLTGAAFFGIFE